MKAYEWKPIEDLPEDWTKLASSELAGLASVWREHYETIKDSKALKQFNERLRREWAIETGIIENLYYIDRGVTLTLIEKGIEASLIPHGTTDKPAELIVPILKDQEEVVTGLFDFVGQQRHLSTSYIKQLHQALTQHQRTTAAKDSFGQMIEVELLRGDWKRMPNNPTKSDGSIHEYCPPEQVASEMDQLIAWHQEHLEKQVPPEVEAAWLHHRFTQIHPFQDGNGRMARTLASLIFLRAGLFPLVIHRDERDDYIDALEIADQGNLKILVQSFSRLQKKAINQAINSAENVLLEGAAFDQIVAAATDRLKKRKEIVLKDIRATGTQFNLYSIAEAKLREVAASLHAQLRAIDLHYAANVGEFLSEEDEDAVTEVNDDAQTLAKTMGYHASFSEDSLALTLNIETDKSFQLALSFHKYGDSIDKIKVVSAFMPSVYEMKNLTITQKPPQRLADEIFQYTDREPLAEIRERFRHWLDEVILNGLNQWRQQL